MGDAEMERVHQVHRDAGRRDADGWAQRLVEQGTPSRANGLRRYPPEEDLNGEGGQGVEVGN
eukprot:10903926-Alexandrium_andersonii.AAC.1